jgi:hypothetical protein
MERIGEEGQWVKGRLGWDSFPNRCIDKGQSIVITY